MKPTITGNVNGTFSKEIDHTDADLVRYQTGFLLDDTVTEKAIMLVFNNMGEVTVLKMEDWNIEVGDVFDENGLPV